MRLTGICGVVNIFSTGSNGSNLGWRMVCGRLSTAINFFWFLPSLIPPCVESGVAFWHIFTNYMWQKWHFTTSEVWASKGLAATMFAALTQPCKKCSQLLLRMRSYVESNRVTSASSQHLQPALQVMPSWLPSLAESPANLCDITESSWNQQRNGHTAHSIVRNNKPKML